MTTETKIVKVQRDFTGQLFLVKDAAEDIYYQGSWSSLAPSIPHLEPGGKSYHRASIGSQGQVILEKERVEGQDW